MTAKKANEEVDKRAKAASLIENLQKLRTPSSLEDAASQQDLVNTQIAHGLALRMALHFSQKKFNTGEEGTFKDQVDKKIRGNRATQRLDGYIQRTIDVLSKSELPGYFTFITTESSINSLVTAALTPSEGLANQSLKAFGQKAGKSGNAKLQALGESIEPRSPEKAEAIAKALAAQHQEITEKVKGQAKAPAEEVDAQPVMQTQENVAVGSSAVRLHDAQLAVLGAVSGDEEALRKENAELKQKLAEQERKQIEQERRQLEQGEKLELMMRLLQQNGLGNIAKPTTLAKEEQVAKLEQQVEEERKKNASLSSNVRQLSKEFNDFKNKKDLLHHSTNDAPVIRGNQFMLEAELETRTEASPGTTHRQLGNEVGSLSQQIVEINTVLSATQEGVGDALENLQQQGRVTRDVQRLRNDIAVLTEILGNVRNRLDTMPMPLAMQEELQHIGHQALTNSLQHERVTGNIQRNRDDITQLSTMLGDIRSQLNTIFQVLAEAEDKPEEKQVKNKKAWNQFQFKNGRKFG